MEIVILIIGIIQGVVFGFATNQIIKKEQEKAINYINEYLR